MPEGTRSIYFDVGRNATMVIELAVGLASVWPGCKTARRSHAELERAARLAALARRARSRPSRQVHDGVMQVLALVACRGREIGGATAELVETRW